MIHEFCKDIARKDYVTIALVGCGGTGSQMVTCLARLNVALEALGKQRIGVVAFDPDRVSEANVGRQLFLRGEIGAHKSVALITRANMQFGTFWQARSTEFEPGNNIFDIVITCVDTVAARVKIASELHFFRNPCYWLDMGKKRRTGQAWLGLVNSQASMPTILEAFPSEYDANEPEDNEPSCSLAAALKTQDLFVNDFAARYGADLLQRLLQDGKTDIQGWFFDLDRGANPVYIQSPVLTKTTKRGSVRNGAAK